jgi:hypothetical protein
MRSNQPAFPQQAALGAGLAEDLGGEEEQRVDAAALLQALFDEPVTRFRNLVLSFEF